MESLMFTLGTPISTVLPCDSMLKVMVPFSSGPHQAEFKCDDGPAVSAQVGGGVHGIFQAARGREFTGQLCGRL